MRTWAKHRRWGWVFAFAALGMLALGAISTRRLIAIHEPQQWDGVHDRWAMGFRGGSLEVGWCDEEYFGGLMSSMGIPSPDEPFIVLDDPPVVEDFPSTEWWSRGRMWDAAPAWINGADRHHVAGRVALWPFVLGLMWLAWRGLRRGPGTAACSACGYSLIGLAPGAGGVTCPECGTRVPART